MIFSLNFSHISLNCFLDCMEVFLDPILDFMVYKGVYLVLEFTWRAKVVFGCRKI